MRAPRLRLVTILGAVLASIALASGMLAWQGAHRRALDALEHDLERAAALVRELLAGLPPDASPEALRERLARGASAAEARITLIAPDGRVIADSDVASEALDRIANHASRPEVAAALAGRTGSAQRHSATVGRTFLYVAVPREAGRTGSGAIRLARDLDGVERELAGVKRSIVGSILLGLALSLGAVLLLLRRAVDHPVLRIHGTLERIAAGELTARTHLPRQGALGEIAAAIDRMASELEQRLREINGEKEQLSRVLGGMVEGVLVIGSDGRIQLANRSLRQLFGVEAELVGKRPIEGIRHAAIEDALLEAARGTTPVVREIALGTAPLRVIRLHASSFPTAAGSGVVAVFHDVTELQRVETMRRDFVTHASHELKTPITALRGFTEMLAEGSVPAADQPRVLGIVRNQVQRLQRLVEDLLELARAERDPAGLELRSVDPVAAARTALDGLEPRFAERRITGELDASTQQRVLADPDALDQVLSNLLDNALKYTEPGGRVVVRVADAAEHVRLSVEDTGVGIPEADRARIFERFYRVDKARSRALGGTGLGLAIVKHLVQAMGGEISVESTPGVGSTFHVLLPRA